MTAYNTNLAAEFFVLSMLYRKGISANLTLGNRKEVDIVVEKPTGELITIDVKGIAGSTSWPVDNFVKGRNGHFLVFVSFKGRIESESEVPEVYIVPSTVVGRIMYKGRTGRKFVELRALRKKGKYRDCWELLQ